MGILEDAAKNWVLAREDYLNDPGFSELKYEVMQDREEFLVRMVRALVINPDNHLGPS